MGKRSLLSLVALWLAVSVNAMAAEKWNSVRSKNFNLVGNATESQIKSVASDLEQFRDAFVRTFPGTAKLPTAPTTVVVLKSAETMQMFRPATRTVANAGYFQAAEDTNYIVLTAGAPIPRAVYHDYVHQLARDLPATIPLWFSEGIAEFFSTFEILPRERKFSLGQRIPEHMELLRKDSLLPLEELFVFSRNISGYNQHDRRGMYYAQSWALVHYLMSGNRTRPDDVSRFLSLLGQGSSAAESFQTAFKSDSATMVRDLEKYVKDRADWTPMGSNLKERNEIERDIKTVSLTEADTEYYIGDLLLHIGRLPDAETHLKQAVILDARHSPALSSLGMLLFRQDNPEAVQHLKRATEIDPRNYLAQYHYAYVLDKNSGSPLDDLDDKRTALGKAIEAAPQFVPAYELMAFVNITADIDYNGTIELLQKANTYAPANPNLRFLLAQVLVKKEDFTQATRILQSLRNAPLDASLSDAVRSLSNLIERTTEKDEKDREAAEARARRDDEAARAANEAARAAAAAPAPQPVAPEPAAAEPTPAPTSERKNELVPLVPQRVLPQGPKVSGLLTLIDCTNGVTLTVKTPTETVKFHAAKPDAIEFFSHVPNVGTEIRCGPTPGSGVPVIVTYRPTPGGAGLGEPILVEFVEK